MAAWVVRHGKHGEFEEQALECDKVFPNWDEAALLVGVRDWEELKQIVQSSNYRQQMWAFLKKIQRRDIVVMPRKGKPIVAIGKVMGDCEHLEEFIPSEEDGAPGKGVIARSVYWVDKEVPRSILPKELQLDIPQTVYELHEGIERLQDIVDRESTTDPWDEFVRRAKVYIDSGKLAEEETNYKVEIAGKLAEARRAVLAGEGGWQDKITDGLRNKGGKHGAGNLLNWRGLDNFEKWLHDSPADALLALRAIWTEDDASISQRIHSFSDRLARPVSGGVGVRARLAAVLAMGLDVERHPPFMTSTFEHAYGQTAYAKPDKEAEEAALYEHALGFLDRFIDEAERRGLPLRHRLDAQSVMWAVVGGRGNEVDVDDIDGEEKEEESFVETIETLADSVFLPVEFLEKIRWLLRDKKQVIFQGPPGTGKTFVAKKLVDHLTGGDKERYSIVQFHPSYAYEDFVQGFRPTESDSGQIAFQLKPGPLIRLAESARNNPHNNYYLIIDEINRGNLAKVFGELYFLLEYRGEEISLQYSDEGRKFCLPKNLYIIGTMNTADRSIALVDLALRRRFHFMEFRADESPIGDVLRKWLAAKAPDMDWVARVVEQANGLLADEDAAIGPSYFMKENLDESMVRLIWEHNVLPYIAERLHGQRERLSEFDLEKLRNTRNGLGGDDVAVAGDGEDDATN